MHLVNAYSLSTGVKVRKPFIYEKYVPLMFDRYISFHKNQYPYFYEVLSLISPSLDKAGIEVLQIKTQPGEQEHKNAIANILSMPELAYVIRNSMLHFGEDDFVFDFCGHFNVPFVALFSNTLPENFAPYWNPDNGIILQTTGELKKPTFSGDPNLNFVRYINPETIAEAIMKKLNIPWQKPYETVFIGDSYRAKHDMIELYPESMSDMNINGYVATLCVRMDYKFNEQFLAAILSRSKAAVITDAPINMNLLSGLKQNISDIVYFIDKNLDLNFAKDMMKLNLPHAFVSRSTGAKFGQEKAAFFEISHITHKPIPSFDSIPKFKDGVGGLSFKSSKRLISGQNEFKCQSSFISKSQSRPEEFEPCVDSDNFREEIQFFHIVKPLTLP